MIRRSEGARAGTGTKRSREIPTWPVWEMKARSRWSACRVPLGALLVVVIALLAPAAASAAVTLTLTQPVSGARTGPHPTFAGTTEEDSGSIKVVIRNEEGEPVGEPLESSEPTLDEWSVSAVEALPAGSYTAQATQLVLGGTETAHSEEVSFTVDTSPPTVTLEPVTTPSNVTKPSFSGSASEAGPVTVDVYEGASAVGTPVASVVATASAGAWEAEALTSALPDGEYTAVASEPSAIGNAEGVSGSVTFVVDTKPPTVTLDAVQTPWHVTKPAFSGSASEAGTVTVKVYAGAKAEGTVVTSVTASASGGKWSSAALSPALAEGEYTAQASEPSAIGNADGVSGAVTFTVITKPPTVTLSAVTTPSNVTKPSFSGTASEAGTVTVKVYAGAKAEGTVVTSVTASASGGTWSSAALSSALAEGEYTAQASEPSDAGNAAGASSGVTFKVITKPPTVTLDALTSPSNVTEPSFAGIASEVGTVTVKVYKGGKAEGTVVASVTASASGGAWSSAALSSALANGEYTALASEPSDAGNAEGTSGAVTFVVDTEPPTVTLNAVPARSNVTKPSFSGAASEAGTVTVKIYKGAKAEGAVVASTSGPASGGTWTSAALPSALAEGEYTAQASEPSGIGNDEGKSLGVQFEVITKPPTVTLSAVTTPSNVTKPSFSGTASEAGTVTVKVYAGAKAEGTVVTSVTASASGGTWSSAALSSALAEGEYTAQASEPSDAGNAAGASSGVTFKVITKPPTVTLDALTSPSNVTEPSFAGIASEVGTVTVKVYKGGKAEGTVVASVTASASGGAWSSAALSSALANSEYTALASEPSDAGNAEGTSGAVTFVVDTEPPTVTLNAVPARSNVTKPSFSGAASEAGTVTVKIYKGAKAEGAVVASTSGPASGGTWSSAALSSALAEGEYTAQASEPSGLGNAEGVSPSATFKVITKPPTVTLNAVTSPSNVTKPSFTGNANEAGTVTVKIYKGPKAEGTQTASATATVSLGKWSTAALAATLAEGEYTAIASEPSGVGNAEGKSSAVTFQVITKPPTVTVDALSSPSNVTEPSFAGTANEAGTVTVKVYAGAKAEGTVVASVTGSASGGAWSTAALSSSLANGEYAAVASEPSDLGNAEGVSGPVTFVVDTEPPTVTLSAVASQSNVTKPSFSGTASEAGTVTVDIYAGARAEGTVVASTTASASAGKWASTALAATLVEGEYTARASEPSAIGNAEGVSGAVKFTVITKPPTVVLNPVTTPSNTSKPSFSGTASETGTVTVRIYAGAKAEGSVVASVTASASGGTWSSAALSSALAEGEYTAQAGEPSGLGNAEGKSNTRTFVLILVPPTVALNAVASPSKDNTPSFSGTAGETGTVTVDVYAGAKAEGPVVASVTASASSGTWASAALSSALADGEYTARASEPSDLGNAEGESSPVTFVVDTKPPVVVLNPLPTPSKNNKPSFSGTSSESEPVTVKVYAGSKAEGTVVASATATVSAGKWTSAALGSALPDGPYTAVASEPSAIGNGPGTSNTINFTVDTKPPEVVLEKIPTRSKVNKPSFNGTASEAGTVTVKIYKGSRAEGTQTASATASVSSGKWTTAALAATLPDGEYAAIASEPSGLGNAEGKSSPITFTVDTKPPTVTLNPIARSNETKPSFSGEASESEPVTVRIYSGNQAEGSVVASATASVSGGKWSSAALSSALPSGEYTAQAGEPSGLGNAEGKSNMVKFVVDTEPPTVTLAEVPPRSNHVKPSFSGTASESEAVTVKVYEGSRAQGTPVATLDSVGERRDMVDRGGGHIAR